MCKLGIGKLPEQKMLPMAIDRKLAESEALTSAIFLYMGSIGSLQSHHRRLANGWFFISCIPQIFGASRGKKALDKIKYSVIKCNWIYLNGF